MTTFYILPDIGSEIEIFTHLVVRDDAHLLFGFATENERHLFRNLIKVNGVGAKMAITILSGIEADEFSQCIQNSDAERLIKLPGVGKKTAERLIIEMRDRLDNFPKLTISHENNKARVYTAPVDEAVSALTSLGYKPSEASRYVLAIADDNMSSEELIRKALKHSVKK
jgi:Holliday junction DNA helicase RuvA